MYKYTIHITPLTILIDFPMSQSLSDIILHVVFSTKMRHPMISQEIETNFFKYISLCCNDLDSPIISINGTEDHIHILTRFGKHIAISKFIGVIKANSSRWIKQQHPKFEHFTWQKGYGAFSVSRRNIEAAENYIRNQKEHHKTMSFQEEFIKMLKQARIAYDEKYLWD